MNKLHFLTAGTPLKTKNAGYKKAFNDLKDMMLDGMEVEFVHGVRISDENKKFIKEFTTQNNLITTAHGPYYINLNAKEQDKVDASIERIINTALTANEFNGYSITYHAAYYMGQTASDVTKRVFDATKIIVDELKKQNVNIWIRPETTGKPTQWGTIEEIVELSKKFDIVLPCVDFSHIHARTNGTLKVYDDFARIFDYIANSLGQRALDNFHAHIAGIEYSIKGERKHLNLEESDMNYKDLLKAFKDFNVKGVVICESPNIEDDALLLKNYYESL